MNAKGEHHRVSESGISLGTLSAQLHRIGRAKLVDAGLVDLNLPAVRDEMCASCACRTGTVPNGCAQTQMDLLKSVVEGQPFLCHAPHDGRMCAGYVGARAAYVMVGPFPLELDRLLADWKYSPPDDETPEAT